MSPLKSLLSIPLCLLAPISPSAPAAQVEGELLCPFVCDADPDFRYSGSVPNGAVLVINITDVVDGQGDDECFTCPGQTCTCTVSLTFDTVDPGICLNYRASGQGWVITNQPTQFGTALESDCDQSDPEEFRANVQSCGPSGGSGFQSTITLYCPCTP